MRDALLIAGAIPVTTKGARAYAENTLDLGADSNLGDVHGLYACFQLSKDMQQGDSFLLEALASSFDYDFSTIIDSGSGVTGGKAGDVFTLPLPKKVGRYLKLAVTGNSAGTLDAQDIQAWLEFR